MAVTRIQIPISPDNPFPLGRHVEHDDRSRQYGIEAVPATKFADRIWANYIPILDQSDLLAQGIKLAGDPDALNSCTGNSGVGVIGSAPLWMKQQPSLRRLLRDRVQAEIHAIDLYASSTELAGFTAEDGTPDTYPPHDDGSTGLATAKAMENLGYIGSYTHSFSGVDGLATALQSGPAMVGTNWYEAMFSPKPDGTFEIAGAVAGGHEYVCDAVYVKQKMFRFRNSWTPTWGDEGCFFGTFDQVDRLLGEQGDVILCKA